ncbi:MAG: PEP-CTERM sorting domain-containing protein [Verrucomicrobia bacterium]|nr:PEP-CTERM sorting domain-containing protein [Verrucomicrobiota bacterium]
MRSGRLLCLLAFSALLAGADHAWAANYSFTRIADDTGSFASFGFEPSINNSGAVAFSAMLDSGVDYGIYRGSGGPVTTIATGGAYMDPSINNAGTVAFLDDEGGDEFGMGAIYTGSGGGLTEIAEWGTLPGYYITLSAPSINSAGTAAFVGQFAFDPTTHIYATSGGPLTSIADNSGDFDYFHGFPAINSSGMVAFSGDLAGGGKGIARGSGGSLTTIADTSGPLSGFSDNKLSISSDGTVAFVGDLDAGGSGIFSGNGGALTTIADDSGPFAFFGATASINSSGTVGFFGITDGLNPDYGLFTGGDPLTDRVILVGDALDGSTVGGLSFGRFSLNDNGQVAFYAVLNDGRAGIYRADLLVVPEPSTAALIGAGLAGLMTMRRRVATGKR